MNSTPTVRDRDSPAAVSLAAKIEGAIRGVNELAAWQEQQLLQTALLGRRNAPPGHPRPPLPPSPPPTRSLSLPQQSQLQGQQQSQLQPARSRSRPPLPPGPPPRQSPQRPPSSRDQHSPNAHVHAHPKLQLPLDARRDPSSNSNPNANPTKRLQQFRAARRRSKSEAAETTDVRQMGVPSVRQLFSQSAADPTDARGPPGAEAEAAVSHALLARRRALALLEEHRVRVSYSPELAQKALNRVREQDSRRGRANMRQ